MIYSDLTSYSHWGMFPPPEPCAFFVPDGFVFNVADWIEEMARPNGIIRMTPVERA